MTADVAVSGGVRLRAAYQPIVNLRSEAVVAVEGLIRGERDDVAVSPADLFGAAKRAGPSALVHLDEACMRCVVRSASGVGAGATVFVNVEPATLAALSPDVLAEIAAVLPPSVQVVVEVTERDLLRQPARLLAGIQRVRELGWRIALDDVGAEPAALALMPFLRPDVIKLDLALVRGRPTLGVAAIVNAVQAEAQRSGALVLAEGIETEAHLQRALSLGATLGQGWHFGRPGPLPKGWRGELRFPPAPAPAPRAGTVFDLISATVPSQPTTPSLLGPLTRQLERQAMLLDEMAVVLASFQDVAFISPAVLRRYELLARMSALTVMLGPGVPSEPVPGVLGVALHEDDPLSQEWVVTVVSPHFAAAVAARELGAGDGLERRLEYVLTYDRDQVVAAAGLLMSKVQGQSAARRSLEPEHAGRDAAAAGTSGRRPAAEGVASPPAGRRWGVPEAALPGLLTRAISTASNGIVIADARARDMPLVYANEAFERLTGYSQEDVVGRNCRLLQGPGTDPTITRVIARRLVAGRGARATLLNYRRDGGSFWNELTISPVHDEHGRLTHFIGNQVDVTERVDRDERTAFLAYHDSLTGLPNRGNVLEHLDLELRRAARSGARVAVAFVDLDRFKQINDDFGHAVGDQALIATGHRLREAVRSGDMLARLGGDEFLLVLGGLSRADDTSVQHAVERVHVALDAPLALAGRTVRLSAGIGFALFPDDGADAATLIDTADARMLRSKATSARGTEAR
ncbi:diguanylate cyclase [Actinotalea ferrariae]|uniref:diguanylate cyclase domain-containing protein n=1 Tax=Actinotalea ferrariae TaxID=1386098 RepID=UPI001C8C05CB|nr:diguanylate cyclase [Actinotalea ferrariae]MBX9243859.1 diguanylate cyclase [Actinotalea ferrariae]